MIPGILWVDSILWIIHLPLPKINYNTQFGNNSETKHLITSQKEKDTKWRERFFTGDMVNWLYHKNIGSLEYENTFKPKPL